LSLLLMSGTDCPSRSVSWMPLLQNESTIPFLWTPLWDNL
jgi:hypothetical protein